MSTSIADMHCDLLSFLAVVPGADPFDKTQIACAFPWLKEGGVKMQVMAIYTTVDSGSRNLATKQAAIFDELLRKEKETVCRFDGDFIQNQSEKDPIGIIASVENAAGFGTHTAPQRQLDPLPLLIAAEEWQVLEAGMLQRQRLLQAVLNDVYGAQQTIRDNLLPAEALFRAADYLLPAAGLLAQPLDWLPLLSLDLAKDAAGQWCVLADHAVVPAGLGEIVGV